MSSDDVKALWQWVKEEYLPDEARKKNLTLKSVKSESACELGSDHFTSNTLFMQLELEDNSKNVEQRNVLVKIPSQNLMFRKLLGIDQQFFNEINVYKRIFPIFDRILQACGKSIYDLVPGYFCGQFNEQNPGNSVVAINDLREQSFEPPKTNVEMDFNHLKLAFSAIAQFHAVSLTLKEKNPTEFQEITQSLKEARYEESRKDNYNKLVKIWGCYGIDLVRERDSTIPESYLEKLVKKFEDSMAEQILMAQPTEPLSVLCHGDFNCNNLLFAYEDEKPIGIKLIDFQVVRHSTPFFDLSVMIYLNMTQETRQKHLPELLRLYHKSLVSCAAECLNENQEDVQKRYPFSLLEENFSKCAIYGYKIACFFLPQLMCKMEGEDIEESLAKNTPEERAARMMATLTEDCKQRLADIIKDMYQRKFYTN